MCQLSAPKLCLGIINYSHSTWAGSTALHCPPSILLPGMQMRCLSSRAEESPELQVRERLVPMCFAAPQPLLFSHLLIFIFSGVSIYKHLSVKEFR